MIDWHDLRDKIARSTLGKRPWLWTQEDWEDAQQAAAVGILDALKRDPNASEAYLVGAGKNEVYSWMRIELRNPRGLELFAWSEWGVHDTAEATGRRITAEQIASLAPRLKAARIISSNVEERHIADEVCYLQLLVEGHSMEGIAREMGIAYRNAYALRERLLPRLEAIASGQQRERRTYEIRPASRAALDRINSDSEMIARRGQAIRDGWARRRAQRQREEAAQ